MGIWFSVKPLISSGVVHVWGFLVYSVFVKKTLGWLMLPLIGGGSTRQ
jgi:hypothetical protein